MQRESNKFIIALSFILNFENNSFFFFKLSSKLTPSTIKIDKMTTLK